MKIFKYVPEILIIISVFFQLPMMFASVIARGLSYDAVTHSTLYNFFEMFVTNFQLIYAVVAFFVVRRIKNLIKLASVIRTALLTLIISFAYLFNVAIVDDILLGPYSTFGGWLDTIRF